VAEYDKEPPWWVRDAVAGVGGGAAGIAVYKAATGEGRDEPDLLLAIIILAGFIAYVVAVAKWRQAHRLRR
jgi:hypothetical protein